MVLSSRPYHAAALGAASLPPGRYFRMHLVGYVEGIASERGIEWRCADSLSLRGRENVQKRYLVHVAAYNLGLILRALLGAGPVRELAARGSALIWLADPEARVAILLVLVANAPFNPTSSTGC